MAWAWRTGNIVTLDVPQRCVFSNNITNPAATCLMFRMTGC